MARLWWNNMRKETFGYRIIKSLFSVFTGVGSLIGIILSFVFWKYKSDQQVSLFLLVIICSVLCLLLAVFIRLAIQLFGETQDYSVKVLSCLEPYEPYKYGESILLTTNSKPFAIDGIVSIFTKKNDCEIFVATGQIINIQQDDKVQILVSKNSNTDFDWEALKKNDKDQLEKLIVKTIVTTQLLGGNLNG